MTKKTFLLLAFILCIFAGLSHAGPPGAPPAEAVAEGTAALLTEGTDNTMRLWDAATLATQFSGAAAEIVNEAVTTANMTDDTAHGVSQHALITYLMNTIDPDGDGSIADSALSLYGLTITGSDGLHVGVAATTKGTVRWYDNTAENQFHFDLYASNFTQSWGIALPTAYPTVANSLFTVATNGVASWTDPATFLPVSLYDANTVLYATADDTPAALTVAEQRVVGRTTGGNIAALTLGNAAGNVAQWPDDPAAHTLFGFDNTGNIYRPITIGSGLSYDQASNTITGTGSALSDLDDLPGDTVDDNLVDAALLASITAAQLDPVLAFADGDILDLSGITQTVDTDEGLVLPNWANVVPASNKKFIAADGNNLKLYNGGWVTIGATAAPTDVQYLTLAPDATLSAERTLTAGSDGIDFTDAGANGALTITVDATEIGTETWGAGAGITWTFDASGGTDPTIAFGDGSITASALTVTGALTANGGVTLQTTDHLTVGAVQWDNGSDLIDGEQIAADTIDDDSIDFSDVTLEDFVTPTTQYNVMATANGTTWGTVDLDANYLPADTMYSGGSGYGGLIFGDSTPDAAGEIGYASNVVSFHDGTAARTLATLATNQAFTGNNTFAGTSGFNGEITMGADFNLNANEIQSTGNVVLQLGDAAGSNKFSIQDSGGVEVFSVNSDGGMASGAVADPYLYFNDNDMATEFAIRSIDSATPDHLAIGTTTDAMAANFTELGYFDADGFYYAGNVNISTGHTYQINGTQINIGNLGAGGNWTPTGTVNFGSSTLQSIGAGTVTNGASYSTISNNAAHDTVDELFAAINSWASGVSAGTLLALSDVGGSDVYTAGYLMIGDGTDSFDPKEVSGAITINSSGVAALSASPVVATALVPDAADGATIGTSALEFSDLFLADAGVINFGADQDVTLTHVADTGLLLNGAMQLQLRDSAIYIASLNDGYMDIEADTAVRINTDLVVSGTIGGAIASTTDADGQTLSAAMQKGYMHWATGAGTINLAAITAGDSFCIHSTTAAAVVINPDDADVIWLDGAALAAGAQITSDSTAGAQICFIARDAENLHMTSRTGTWTGP